jgi:hypothetical protein
LGLLLSASRDSIVLHKNLKRENLKIIRYKDETGSETGTGVGGKNSGSRSGKKRSRSTRLESQILEGKRRKCNLKYVKRERD